MQEIEKYQQLTEQQAGRDIAYRQYTNTACPRHCHRILRAYDWREAGDRVRGEVKEEWWP